MLSPSEGRGRWRHRFFLLAMVAKGIDGLVELAGGVALLLLGPSGVDRVVTLLTRHELGEDPGDPLAAWLADRADSLGLAALHFAAAYLLVHGVIKVGLVAGLIQERPRVFPVALVILGLFLVYQLYRLTVHPTLGLGVLSVIDVGVVILIWQEYRALVPKGSTAGQD